MGHTWISTLFRLRNARSTVDKHLYALTIGPAVKFAAGTLVRMLYRPSTAASSRMRSARRSEVNASPVRVN